MADQDSEDEDAEFYLDRFIGDHLERYKSDDDTASNFQGEAFIHHLFLTDKPRLTTHFSTTGSMSLPITRQPLVLEEVYSDTANAVQKVVDQAYRDGQDPIKIFDGNMEGNTPEWRKNERKMFNEDRKLDMDKVTDDTPIEYLFPGPYFDNPTPFHASMLRCQDDTSFFGTDFMERHVPKEQEGFIRPVDGLTPLPAIEYRSAYMSKPMTDQKVVATILALQKYTSERAKIGDTAFARRMNARELYDVVPQPFDVLDLRCASHEHKTPGITEGLIKEAYRFFCFKEFPERVQSNPAAKRAFLRRMEKFDFFDDRLWYIGGSQGVAQMVIFIDAERKIIMKQCHNGVGHRGREVMLAALLMRFYWPGIYDDVAFFCRSCNACQYHSRARPKVPFHLHNAPSVARHFHADTIVMPKGKGGMRYLLHVSDDISKWAEAIPARRNDTRTWSKFLYNSLICRFGCQIFLSCDGGSEFKGLTKAMMEDYGIPIIVSSPYHPEGNGIAERDGQSLKWAVTKMCGDDIKRWPDHVSTVLWAIRSTISRVTGYTPAFLLYGQNLLFPFDITHRTLYCIDWVGIRSHQEAILARAQMISRHRTWIEDEVSDDVVRTRMQEKHRIMEKYRLKTINEGIPVGALVLLHQTRNASISTSQKWVGPFVVRCRYPSGTYGLSELDGSQFRDSVAATRLKIFYIREEHQSMPVEYEFDQPCKVLTPWWPFGGRPVERNWRKAGFMLNVTCWAGEPRQRFIHNAPTVAVEAAEHEPWW